jgi:hypothetical protein
MARGVVPCYRAVLAAIGLGKNVEVVLSVLAAEAERCRSHPENC